jgi:ElaB/YqjD/DUF883 family membrane-anchored ribosome-binding protein
MSQLTVKVKIGGIRMAGQGIENKVRQGSIKLKKDLGSLVDDGASVLSERVDKLKVDAKDTVADVAETIKKDVGHVLSQYNAKVKEVADKVPGGLNEKVSKYPWVAMSIALVFGFFLGSLCKPGRRHHR